jgi:hypothetical protein
VPILTALIIMLKELIFHIFLISVLLAEVLFSQGVANKTGNEEVVVTPNCDSEAVEFHAPPTHLHNPRLTVPL